MTDRGMSTAGVVRGRTRRGRAAALIVCSATLLGFATLFTAGTRATRADSLHGRPRPHARGGRPLALGEQDRGARPRAADGLWSLVSREGRCGKAPHSATRSTSARRWRPASSWSHRAREPRKGAPLLSLNTKATNRWSLQVNTSRKLRLSHLEASKRRASRSNQKPNSRRITGTRTGRRRRLRGACGRSVPGGHERTGRRVHNYGPVIEQVTPAEVSQGAETHVTVNGKGFEGTKKVELARERTRTPRSRGADLLFWRSTGRSSFTVASNEQLPNSRCRRTSCSASTSTTKNLSRGFLGASVTSPLGRSAPSEHAVLSFGPRVTGLSRHQAATGGGAEIVVDGHGFVNGETTVKFGAATAAAGLFVSPQEVIATTPMHATEKTSVTVTTPTGTSQRLEDPETVAFIWVRPRGLEAHAGAIAGGNRSRSTASASKVRQGSSSKERARAPKLRRFGPRPKKSK